MENLRLYLNSLSFADQQAYATACGTTVNYLRKAISKRSRFDGALALQLDKYSNGHVKKWELRPDIWPELEVLNQPIQAKLPLRHPGRRRSDDRRGVNN